MNTKLYKLMNWPEIEEIIYSDGSDPHRILGAHKIGNNLLVQMFYPGAKEVNLCIDGDDEDTFKMEQADEAGFFASLIPYIEGTEYHYEILTDDDKQINLHDAYNFGPFLEREDFIKFNSGIHMDIYEKLGSRPMERNGYVGVNFSVWAPGAIRVSVVGDFNGWDGRIHQMRKLDPNGVFEIFIPDVSEGDKYQFEIKTKAGITLRRNDPYALSVENTENGYFSVVKALHNYEWEDSTFLQNQKKINKDSDPLSICEISIDKFINRHRSDKTLKELTPEILDYVDKHGFDVISLSPVMEHAADHNYHILNYYAVHEKYGDADELKFFVNEAHKREIAVIFEWVPTFFDGDEGGLSDFTGKPLYEYPDPRKGYRKNSPDKVFDFGRKEVCNFLTTNALYWLKEFHADGFRLSDISKVLYLDYDRAAGEWEPNIYGGNENLEAAAFMRNFTEAVHKYSKGALLITKETACYPKVTLSLEEGGLGFDYKWNNGWTKDILTYVQNDPIFRGGRHNELTNSILYCYSERFILSINHEDLYKGLESLYDMMPGDSTQKLCNTRFVLSYLYTYPGKKMLAMDPDALNMDQSIALQNMLSDLNTIYYSKDALSVYDTTDAGFEWINNMDAQNCRMSFVRHGKKKDDFLLVVCNMSGVMQEFNVGVPEDGKYSEIFSSDKLEYGGSGISNGELQLAERKAYDGRAYCIKVKLAPCSVSILSFTPYTEEEKKIRKIKEEEEIRKEKEIEKSLAELKAKQDKEEEKILKELRERYEKELAQQRIAIEEKYEKIQEEKINAVVSSATGIEKSASKAASKKTSSKKSTTKAAAKKTSKNKKK
ncbi:MAG: 1,4-alpha-glucan branching enzyme [Butyrivibrio sp.]|nr:1,4-alpha-glucan branching enzyme [Butyrivibrio sp.]